MRTGEYNGWANYQTWNMHLWLTGRDESTYSLTVEMVKKGHSPRACAIVLIGKVTPDGVSVQDPSIDWDEIARALRA